MGVGPTELVELDAPGLRRRRDELSALVADAIEANASVGFILPVDTAAIDAYWDDVESEVRAGSRLVFGALQEDHIVGSVQLALCTKPNQPHRADVQKLIVRRTARGRGIAGALMQRLEARASASGRWLLTLDTRSDSAADRLYMKWGWHPVGRIPDYALDPDGTLAACTFYWKRLA